MPPWGSGHLLPAAAAAAAGARAEPAARTGRALTPPLAFVVYIPALPKAYLRGGFAAPQGRGRSSDLPHNTTQDFVKGVL